MRNKEKGQANILHLPFASFLFQYSVTGSTNNPSTTKTKANGSLTTDQKMGSYRLH